MEQKPELASFLEDFWYTPTQIDWSHFISALIVSLVAALIASGLYRFFYERRATGSQVHRAFPLLALAITTLFVCIQTSLPLSLGLLGALSIIRFRTPIKEPEEVGFIMLVIASSIAAATFNYPFIYILYSIAIITLFALRGTSGFRFLRRDGVVVLSFSPSAGSVSVEGLEEILRTSVSRLRLESAASSGNNASWQYVFSGLKIPVPELQKKLQEAVPSVPLSLNIYLDRPGGLR